MEHAYWGRGYSPGEIKTGPYDPKTGALKLEVDVKDGGPSVGMRVIARSTGNSLPSARTAVISTRLPSTRASPVAR